MERPFERISVIGCGTLGTQIALLAAFAGYTVHVFDRNPEAFSTVLGKLRNDLHSRGIDPFIPWDQWDVSAKGIRLSDDLESAVGQAQLIVEAVPENLELKRRVFQDLGRLSPPETIIATNSSSIPVSKIEGYSGRPEHCLNLHFYMPLQGMNMADVMGGTRTSPDVLRQGIAFVRTLGVVPLTVKKESLGFCFNRVWRAVKKETLSMWAQGAVDFRDVDRGWMIFTGMPDGPFGLMDKVGLDVVYDIEMVYHRESGDPADRPPKALKEKIDRGELGVKTGKGFYTYPDPEYRKPNFLNPESE